MGQAAFPECEDLPCPRQNAGVAHVSPARRSEVLPEAGRRKGGKADPHGLPGLIFILKDTSTYHFRLQTNLAAHKTNGTKIAATIKRVNKTAAQNDFPRSIDPKRTSLKFKRQPTNYNIIPFAIQLSRPCEHDAIIRVQCRRVKLFVDYVFLDDAFFEC